MTSHYITLPNGRRCSLGIYVAAWKQLRALAHDASVRGFDHFASDAGDILRQIRLGMHERINRHIPAHGHGRKWSSDWQRATRHCANEVNTPRLIVRYVPTDLRARLAHRINSDD